MTTSSTRLASLLGRPPADAAAYKWLADRLRGLVLDGRLVVGDRVPSERATADALGLSRTTVTAAFAQLRAEGYLLSRQGSNTVVGLPVTSMDRPDEPLAGASAEQIDLTVAALPAPAILGELASEAARRLPTLLAGPGLHPLGLRELRAAVARRMTARGLPTTTDQILITQGALHGWDLVLRALARPGDSVLVEQPTYPAVLDAVLAHSGRLLPVAVSAEGWEAGALAGRTTRRRPPVVGHVTPDFQNPTGLHATDEQRRGILAATSGTVLVVDETFTDLALEPSRTPLAALDPTGRTLTVGTLSKTVWAGLRIGWIRADPALVRRLSLLRGGQDLATPVLDQLFALACLDHLSAIIDERRALVRRRRDHLVAALAGRAPDWRPSIPGGGLVLWVDLGDQSSTQLASDARAAGVLVTPGPRFSATGTHDRFLRLPFSLPEPVLDQAVDALVRVSSTRRPRAGAATSTWTA